MTIKRRDFLKGGAVAAGVFTLGFVIPARTRAGVSPETSFAPNAYIRITPENEITIVLAKSEMGQNVFTVLPMIVAEELDADFKSIRVKQAPVDAAYNSSFGPIMATGGSTSVRTTYDALRQVGATARTMLLAAAADAWAVPLERLTTENSRVSDSVTGKSMSYGELAGAASNQAVPAEIRLKPAGEFRLIGKDQKRKDSAVKVTGQAEFGIDVTVPELKFAAVARPPVFGAKLQAFDDSKAKEMPGFLKSKQIPSGVAVIADSSWRAMKARDALEISWDEGSFGKQSTEKLTRQYRDLAGQAGYVVKQEGDYDSAAAAARHVLEADYEFPFLAHACMEPLNCTVHDQGGKAEIWVGTQFQTIDRNAAAEVLGYEPESVQLHTMFLGGGFGRRAAAYADFTVEAAHVAKGEAWPVKTTWTREDDMRGGQYRPMTLHRSRLALDEKGRPLAWHNRVVSQSLNGMEAFGVKAENFDDSQVEGLLEPHYPVPNRTLEAHLPKSPIVCLWWRSVGHTHTAFMKETLFDEAAHVAGADPMQYRLELLAEHPRFVALLNKVKSMSAWGRDLPTGTGLGVAIEESFGSIVAEVAQVKVDGSAIQVEKVWCAVDCGFAVNPLGVREQMESAVIYGLSAALHGEITFKDGRVVQGNFNDYPVVRMNAAPDVEVEIINSGAAIGGIGEPGTPPIFPAVGNAIFAASGKRLRSLPFRL